MTRIINPETVHSFGILFLKIEMNFNVFNLPNYNLNSSFTLKNLPVNLTGTG